ncbi:Transmembrane receptor kinase [Ectocarpus siliculosus]|uniref:Transmembrane receptor kinase n=1 Tax=Ectocarpus siliculosus TaxID=2880 RepID=D8LRF5_ECTSI|nr:Transmembrane receptor kinase [Ectocarpus siliculosus]|eukprot:CBN75056.1 Transmembrane receptor kinase [Ectocarpus siliculosus]
MGLDESVVLAGSTEIDGEDGFAALELDSEGVELWRWEDSPGGGTCRTYGVTVSDDGSVVGAGYIWSGDWATPSLGETDFIAYKLAKDGTLLWKWQDGTADYDTLHAVVSVDGDGSVVMAGQTSGDFSGISVGSNDFIAIKLDAEGNELWTWQDGTSSGDFVEAAAATGDGSIVLAGYTYGEWSGELAGENCDFAAVKIDANGTEVWRWQGGYAVQYNGMHAVAVQEDGTVLLTGRSGDYNAVAVNGVGASEIAAVMLGVDGEEVWRWKQASSPDVFQVRGMAAGSNGRMLMVGNTNGSWIGDPNLGSDDFLLVMFNTTSLTTSTTPTASPTVARSPAPASQVILPSTTPTTLPNPTLAPSAGSSSTLAPSSGNSSTVGPLGISPGGESASGTAPVLAGVVSAIAAAALITLGVLYKRRQAAKNMGSGRLVPPPSDDDSLEHGRDYNRPQGVEPATSAVVCSDNNQPPHPHKPVEVVTVGKGMAAPSETAPSGSLSSNTEQSTRMPVGPGVKFPGVGTEDVLAQRSLTATGSTADVSTSERAELAGISTENTGRFADEPMPASGEREASSTAGRRGSFGDVGVGQAVMVAAQELAHSCQVPGVSEAVTLVSILVNLVKDSRDDSSGGDSRLRQCRSIVMVLNRADKVAGNGENTTGKVARMLIDDVHEAIFDLVELIKTYQSKNKLSKVLMSTLFKRRQDELDAVVDRAIVRLQLGLQVKVGQDVKAGMDLYKGSITEVQSESLTDARSTRRRRKLDQVEIPEEHVTITNEVLGRGGFGEVYLADYNGRNAAAKVLLIARDLGTLSENDAFESPLAGRSNTTKREDSQRRAFLRELDAMIRLRSPHTVNVYGAVTSLPDRMVLVMELLSGGDLRTLLRNSEQPLPEEQSRRIIGDICAGMAFLHSKDTVHGDLKSANVLLDGSGRAKIGDFGTSRWSQHTNSTGLATYSTRSSQGTQMSLAWSAPEVLESGGSTRASDVYSFGIVVWEVVSGELPWANKSRPREILSAVLMGVRPSFHDLAPTDMVEIAKTCWEGEPDARTTFDAVMEGMKSKGRHQ